MSSVMETFAARLASFDAVLKLEKRRSSTTKGSNVIAWPHQSPSPAELAHAGFYYKPYETNPDNTTCFQCNRALDGWEEDDNPITEHLKHSPDCAWAIMMDIQQGSSNPATIEDPNSERITQARIGTFGTSWPHDGKRGWVCQSDKMVKAGWYFCPNEESDDLASCAYCKLSLDGWEPKDDPFDEHYRRSPDCSFFVFAQLPVKKGKGRPKKTRTSKASSRLSTQSVATVASEAPEASEMDIDEALDESMMSQATVKPKGAKRGPKPKGKKNKDDTDLQGDKDLDTNEQSQLEPAKPKRAGRGKKRASEEMAKDDFGPVTRAEPESSLEPPPKRRARGTRSSSVSQTHDLESQDHSMLDAASVDDNQEEKPKKTRKGSKKGTTTKGRKASDVSIASRSASKARMPRDSELEAEIEAGLEIDDPELVEPEPEPEAEPDMELQHEPEPEPKKTRASKKTKAGKKTKTGGKQPEPPQEDVVDYMDVHEEQLEAPTESAVVDLEDDEAPAPKTKSSKSSKKKGTKKSKKQETVQEEEREAEDKALESERDEPEHHGSFVSVEIIKPEAESQPEPEVEQPAEKPVKKKSSKKEDKPKKSKKTKKVEASPPPPAPQPIEDELDFASSPRDEEEYGTPDDLPDQIQVVTSPRVPSPEPQQIHERTPVPPKTAKRFSDIPKEEHLAQSLAESYGSRSNDHDRRESQQGQASSRAVSPLPVPHQSTPSLSPQSSDAENRPPSSLPSAKRPIVVASPPKERTIRTPLAANTPSPSKRNLNAGFPASAHPWTPVDIDEVLFGEASDKENADLVGLLNGARAGLTSPEKRMTVEEWIRWNAKNGEERLKRECERLVSQFEKEGDRAMRRLEAIECID
ncbi:Protein bir1 [Penicillium rolfsii]|nr:Protein bir1 [Penicillium rolfsii]